MGTELTGWLPNKEYIKPKEPLGTSITVAIIRALGTADMGIGELTQYLTGRDTVGGERDVRFGLSFLEEQKIVMRVGGYMKATRWRLLVTELPFDPPLT